MERYTPWASSTQSCMGSLDFPELALPRDADRVQTPETGDDRGFMVLRPPETPVASEELAPTQLEPTEPPPSQAPTPPRTEEPNTPSWKEFWGADHRYLDSSRPGSPDAQTKFAETAEAHIVGARLLETSMPHLFPCAHTSSADSTVAHLPAAQITAAETTVRETAPCWSTQGILALPSQSASLTFDGVPETPAASREADLGGDAVAGGQTPSQGAVPSPTQPPSPLSPVAQGPGSCPQGSEGDVPSPTQLPCFQASVAQDWADLTPRLHSWLPRLQSCPQALQVPGTTLLRSRRSPRSRGRRPQRRRQWRKALQSSSRKLRRQWPRLQLPLARLLLWWILVRFLPAMGKLQGEGGPSTLLKFSWAVCSRA